VFKPQAEWTAYETRSRALSLEIFKELQIPVHDLIRPLNVAARGGLELTESPGDIWHPSNELARRLARHLIRHGYFESVLGPGGCGPGSDSGPVDSDPGTGPSS
jgi:hypothetical protein